MIVMGHRANLLDYMIPLVSILADRSPFQSNSQTIDEQDDDSDDDAVDEEDLASKNKKKRSLRFHEMGDALARLQAIGALNFASEGSRRVEVEAFCRKNELAQVLINRCYLA